MEHGPFGDVWRPIENGACSISYVNLPEGIFLLYAHICWTWKVVYLVLKQNHPFLIARRRGQNQLTVGSWTTHLKSSCQIGEFREIGVLLAPFGISIIHNKQSEKRGHKTSPHRCPIWCHHVIHERAPKDGEISSTQVWSATHKKKTRCPFWNPWPEKNKQVANSKDGRTSSRSF